MSSLSSSLSSLTLSVSTGLPPNVVTYEQDIPLSSVVMGSNSIMIPDNSSMVTAFNNNPLGTSFSYSLNASYASGLSIVTTNGAEDFVTAAPPVLALDANAVTIKYTGNALTSVPTFVYENPRGTGMEWFAVVDDTSKQSITDYANGTSDVPFIPPGESVPVPFNNIVTTLMTDMSYMFANASTFNQNISSWDTSSVMNMSGIFSVTTSFNQNIGSWNTSIVTNMSYMFNYSSAFNQNIGSWNVSNVTNMNRMFIGASAFNPNIGSWNTSIVTNMDYMFYDATIFNQNISSWNVSSVSSQPPNNFSLYSPLTLENSPVWV